MLLTTTISYIFVGKNFVQQLGRDFGDNRPHAILCTQSTLLLPWPSFALALFAVKCCHAQRKIPVWSVTKLMFGKCIFGKITTTKGFLVILEIATKAESKTRRIVWNQVTFAAKKGNSHFERSDECVMRQGAVWLVHRVSQSSGPMNTRSPSPVRAHTMLIFPQKLRL